MPHTVSCTSSSSACIPSSLEPTCGVQWGPHVLCPHHPPPAPEQRVLQGTSPNPWRLNSPCPDGGQRLEPEDRGQDPTSGGCVLSPREGEEGGSALLRFSVKPSLPPEQLCDVPHSVLPLPHSQPREAPHPGVCVLTPTQGPRLAQGKVQATVENSRRWGRGAMLTPGAARPPPVEEPLVWAWFFLRPGSPPRALLCWL